MKTLLLFQSIASSALRSSRRSSSYAVCNQLANTSSQNNYGRGATLLALGGVGVAGSGMGSSNIAMCSSKEDGEVSASKSKPKKYIDEPENTPQHNPLLPFPESSLRHDTYNGVTLDLTKIYDASSTIAAEEFSNKLSIALDIWSQEKRRGIWLKMPTSHSHLIAPATQQHGFDFQHAEPGYCILTKWLPKDTESRLPNGPTHQVGIGALVIHPTTGKMLAVQERTGPAAKRKLWKMPTGLTDPGEDIATAAVRELKEETGLDCEFDKIICFRQAHGGLFNRSDMFFVCLCRLKSEVEEKVKNGGDIELIPQEEEILMADWIDMDFYATQGVWSESPLYKEMNGAMIHAAKNGIEYSLSSDDNSGKEEAHGFVAKNLPVGFRPGSNTIYVSSKL